MGCPDCNRGITPLSLLGNISENWKLWRARFENYLVASEVNKKDDQIQFAQCLHYIGDEAFKVYTTFKFEDNEKGKLQPLLEKFEHHFIGKENVAYERYKFFTCRQSEDQTTDDFILEAKKLASKCKLQTLRDDLTLTVITCGIKNDSVREKLLEESDLTLEKGIEWCQVIETANMGMEQGVQVKSDVEAIYRGSNNRQQKLEELEMIKIIEQRKKEKEEECLARQRVRDQIEELEMKKFKQRMKENEEKRLARKRVKDQIEADKSARKRVRDQIEELEMKKFIARKRVWDQIEADKLARKAKFLEAKASPTQHSAPATPLEKKPPQNNTEVKLQIRLLDDKVLQQVFGVKERLSAVRLFVEMNRTDGHAPLKLMTNFPKKVFTSEDYDKPLESLGLAPAATLFAFSHN